MALYGHEISETNQCMGSGNLTAIAKMEKARLHRAGSAGEGFAAGCELKRELVDWVIAGGMERGIARDEYISFVMPRAKIRRERLEVVYQRIRLRPRWE